AVAALVVQGGRGGLARQVEPSPPPVRPPGPLKVRRPPTGKPERPPEATPAPGGAASASLLFPNGLGGFSPDGAEYVIELAPGQWTPAPWSNLVANPGFGFLVTEAGGGYTWSVNSRENKLTPWSNDPVTDAPAEAVYLRDEETGQLGSPTPLPIRDEQPYVVRHGQGYSRFEHQAF